MPSGWATAFSLNITFGTIDFNTSEGEFFVTSRTTSSHYWMLHIESLQYIANRRKCTPICSFYFRRKFWNFLSLFKLSFLLVASHHTWYFSESVLLQLSLSEKRWITTMREREANAGGQAHAILPCFCPISHERLVSGQEQGEASEPFRYSRCWYAEWVQKGVMTCIPLPMAHPSSQYHPKAAGAGRTRGRDTAFAAGGLFVAVLFSQNHPLPP